MIKSKLTWTGASQRNGARASIGTTQGEMLVAAQNDKTRLDAVGSTKRQEIVGWWWLHKTARHNWMVLAAEETKVRSVLRLTEMSVSRI